MAPEFAIPYSAIDAAAESTGLDQGRARKIALGVAEEWFANGKVPDSPSAMLLPAFKAHAAAQVPQQTPPPDSGADLFGEAVAAAAKPKQPPKLACEAVELYNELAGRIGLTRVRSITGARSQAIIARIKEAGGIEEFKLALQEIEKSAFCKGKNDRGWKADFDFLCQAKSFHKLREGGYRGLSQQSSAGNGYKPGRL